MNNARIGQDIDEHVGEASSLIDRVDAIIDKPGSKPAL